MRNRWPCSFHWLVCIQQNKTAGSCWNLLCSVDIHFPLSPCQKMYCAAVIWKSIHRNQTSTSLFWHLLLCLILLVFIRFTEMTPKSFHHSWMLKDHPSFHVSHTLNENKWWSRMSPLLFSQLIPYPLSPPRHPMETCLPDASTGRLLEVSRLSICYHRWLFGLMWLAVVSHCEGTSLQWVESFLFPWYLSLILSSWSFQCEKHIGLVSFPSDWLDWCLCIRGNILVM